MYIGKPSLSLYRNVRSILKDKSIIYLTPVADFNIESACNHYLYEYNQMKKSAHRAVYSFEKGGKSFNWEYQMKGKVSYNGKPCSHKDKYVLFDPSLNRYTCSYRQNNDICPNKYCFLV